MKKYFLISVCLIFISIHTFSQTSTLKWGKVSSKEMSMAGTSLDTAANAIVLGESAYIKVDYGSIMIFTHVRIKILNKNGFDEADISLPYYFKDDLENVINIKAQTINVLPNGKIEKTEINKDQIFSVDIDDRWKAKQFTFPAIQEGSIIEYKYTKSSKNYYYLDEWYFQKKLPVLYSELKVTFPEVLRYNSYMVGHKLIGKYGGKATNEYILTNLPPIKDQRFVYNINDYAEKISFQLVSYMKRGDLGSSSEQVNVLESWESLADDVKEDYEYTTFENASKHYEDIISNLPLEEASLIEKVNIIYNYVNESFRWNEKNGVFNSQKFKDFIENRTGNTADINLYLVNLLRTAGIESFPMLISTRSHGIITKDYPLLSQFNRMVAYAELPNGHYVMNAINPYRSCQLPALSDYVDDGFVLKKENPSWVEIDPDHRSRSMFLVDVSFDEGGQPMYEISSQLNGYDALDFRSGISENGNKYIFHQLKNKNITKTDSLTIENLKEVEKPLKLEFGFTANETSMVNDELIYFDPFIFDEFQNNPFNEDRHNFPIELPYESNFNMIMNMHIPDGFEVIGMPRSEKYVLPREVGNFSYQTRFLDDRIQINMKVVFANRKLPKNYNTYLKEFYDILIEKINEQIVMKRKIS